MPNSWERHNLICKFVHVQLWNSIWKLPKERNCVKINITLFHILYKCKFNILLLIKILWQWRLLFRCLLLCVNVVKAYSNNIAAYFNTIVPLLFNESNLFFFVHQTVTNYSLCFMLRLQPYFISVEQRMVVYAANNLADVNHFQEIYKYYGVAMQKDQKWILIINLTVHLDWQKQFGTKTPRTDFQTVKYSRLIAVLFIVKIVHYYISC